MTDAADRFDPSAAADLAFLKEVAAAGRGRPAPAVPLMAVFGLAYGVPEFIVWLEMVAFNGGEYFDGPAPQPWDTLNGVLFISAHLAFFGTLAWTLWRTFQTRGAGMNRGAAAAWAAAFVGLVLTIGCFIIIDYKMELEGVADDGLGSALPPVLLILWGFAWWVTSVVTGRRWLGLVAAASFAAALLAAWVAETGLMKLMVAGCLLLLALLPAAILMRQSRTR